MLHVHCRLSKCRGNLECGELGLADKRTPAEANLGSNGIRSHGVPHHALNTASAYA